MRLQKKDRRCVGFRFSLRALFLVTLVIGCGISWYVSQTRLAMRQQTAVERIRQLGGHATYEYQVDSTRRSRHAPMPPEFLRWLTGNVVMSDVIKVSWHAPHPGAGDTRVLSDLPTLTDLRLNMRQLPDEGIRPVATLTQLRRLDLWCSQITDHALSHLAGLHQLQTLDLYSTQVTDEGLRHLQGLRNLKQLKLRRTNVTCQGAATLQKELPNCEILGVDGWPKPVAPPRSGKAGHRDGPPRTTGHNRTWRIDRCQVGIFQTRRDVAGEIRHCSLASAG